MRATGIVRRMDDLGRVVIPKELRKSMKMREGAPLEIYTHNGAVCFKPYVPVGEADWVKAKHILEILLPCGFTLLDNYGGEQATVQRDAREFNRAYDIIVSGEYMGALVFDSSQAPSEEDVERALDVVTSLFGDAV